MPDLATLAEIKVLMGITGNTEDAYLQAMLSSESQNFMNEIHRQDFSPVATFTDYLMGNGKPFLFLNHYPIQSITSLTINGVIIPQYNPLFPDTLGYVFDTTAPVENRVKLWLRGPGAIFPDNLAYYGWTPPPSWLWLVDYGIVVVYTAGYAIADVPANVKRAIADLIAIKRGVAQVQATTQTGASFTIGDYSEGATSGSSSSSTTVMNSPTFDQSVIDQYNKPQI